MVACGLLSVCFLAGLAFDAYRKHLKSEMLVSEYQIHIKSSEVIGPLNDFRGDPKSPYTLVEFGDYQCPPCHAVNEQLNEILPSLKGRVKFTFRNLPLTVIHPYAMKAATVAEGARSLGKFWTAHDGLYGADAASFNDETIAGVNRSLHVSPSALLNAERTTAVTVISNDVAEAHAIGLTSTPSFLLCCPNGRVVHLSSLSQLSQLVQ
jgi:protein-disulfide isomerase